MSEAERCRQPLVFLVLHQVQWQQIAGIYRPSLHNMQSRYLLETEMDQYLELYNNFCYYRPVASTRKTKKLWHCFYDSSPIHGYMLGTSTLIKRAEHWFSPEFLTLSNPCNATLA
jgi:hypothetical protein